jgi:hypothetical protein
LAPVRRSTAIRAAACAALAAGVAAPLVRRRLRLPALVVLPAAWSAPVAVCVLYPRTRTRDVAVLVLQMWAYLAAYEMPNDDPEALRRRVRVEYPVRLDCVLGLGRTPTLRLQRALGSAGPFRSFEKVLVWSHWLWFLFPHGTAAYLRARAPDRFPRGATMIYATFDLGMLTYWALPTAPPWYAAQQGLMADGRTPELRRMMVEYGAEFWQDRWPRLYGSLAGNPLAAMPSLHFATSVMAAHLLGETGRVAGALAWAYTGTLGFALVYLGEHYVVDLLAGLALTESIRLAAPHAGPVLERATRPVRILEGLARP